MKILLLILFIILIPLLIALARTILLKKKTSIYIGSNDEKLSMDYALKLQKMIQFETVSNRDKPDPDKFRKFHKVLEGLFPNVFKTCDVIDIDGNLIVKLKGEDSSLKPLVITSHLDVVPADGDWSYPPYEGKIVDGKMYGRGTLDVKGAVFAFYQALEEMIIDAYTPKCDVYLASSCTEEIGGDGAPKICQYFVDNNIRPFMLLDEGGCITADPFVGVKGNFAAVGIFEKGYMDVKIIAKGKGGHSSTPGKNTPIARLAKFINEIEIIKTNNDIDAVAQFKELVESD